MVVENMVMHIWLLAFWAQWPWMLTTSSSSSSIYSPLTNKQSLTQS